jgi:hypothetical protein
LLHTDAKRDKSLSVELPIELHKLKEKFTNFQEPTNFSYSHGLTEFLTEVINSIYEVLKNTTPSQRRYVSMEKYQTAYSVCFKAKIQEMKHRYPQFTEREKLMVYHAQVACIADQHDLEKFLENLISTFTLEKGVLGIYFKENQTSAAEVLKLNALQRGSFIKTLAEVCSPECAAVLASIQEQHKYLVQSNFVQIDAITHPLSERGELFNPISITKDLFPNSYNTESGKVESLNQQEIDQVLYAQSCYMGFTNIGNGLPSAAPLINYEAQEAYVNKKDVDVAVVEKVLKANTNLLNHLLENKPLLGDSRQGTVVFKTKNAQEFHAFLIEQDIPQALADAVVIYGGIETLEALQVALNDGTIREIPGVGAKKSKSSCRDASIVKSKCFSY